MAKWRKIGKDVDLLLSIEADLQERARLKVLMDCYSYKAIAERYGLSYSSIYNCAKMWGLLDKDLEAQQQQQPQEAVNE